MKQNITVSPNPDFFPLYAFKNGYFYFLKSFFFLCVCVDSESEISFWRSASENRFLPNIWHNRK